MPGIQSSITSFFKPTHGAANDDGLDAVDSYTLECVREQVEYYLSDANLKNDNFYRQKIKCSGYKDGWFEMKHILTAPRIAAMGIKDAKVIVRALRNSATVQTRVDKKESPHIHLIRRRNDKRLPTWEGSNKRRRYNSSYGDGGYGYSGYDCDRLLECGVKPWDSDAGNVLGALHDY